MEQVWPVLAMLAGVCTHILKKAMKENQLAKLDPAIPPFNLKEYLVGHPYQTVLTFVAGGGAYLTLWENSPEHVVMLSAAFLAGVAANSIGDIAPGDR